MFLENRRLSTILEHLTKDTPMASSSSETTTEHLMRELKPDDYHKSHLALLGDLTEVGKMTEDEYKRLFHNIFWDNTTKIYVIEKTIKNCRSEIISQYLVSSGTLLIEQKFIHKGGKVGHIEDIVTLKTERGYGFASKIIEQLIQTAKAQGCYKVILDCSEHNAGFYKGLGFVEKEKQMAFYLK